MSFARARAIRGLQSTLRSSSARATPRVSAPAWTQLAVGRRYASGGGGHSEPSSDLPWMLGAVAVTIPACWYLWPTSSPDSHHGHDEGHGEHEEAHEDEAPQEDTAPGEEAPTEESESTQQQAEEKDAEEVKDTTDQQEKAKDSEDTAKASGSEGEAQPNAPDGANKQSAPKEVDEDQGQKTGGGKVEGVQFKGKMKEDAPGQEDSRKRESDSKGGYKKRIDSGLQKDLGGTDKQFDDPENPNTQTESSNSSKPARKQSEPDGEGDMSAKQFGLSNTPTRHSEQIDQNPEKSKKPEGGPDTAKSMGPIDPNRPAS